MVVFSVLLFASMLASAGLDFRFSELNPTRPQAETGRVRRYLVYETYVYVSAWEEALAQVLFAVTFVSFLALVFLGVLAVRDLRREQADDAGDLRKEE